MKCLKAQIQVKNSTHTVALKPENRSHLEKNIDGNIKDNIRKAINVLK